LFHYLTKVHRVGDPATAVSAVRCMITLNYCCFWLFIASLMAQSVIGRKLSGLHMAAHVGRITWTFGLH